MISKTYIRGFLGAVIGATTQEFVAETEVRRISAATLWKRSHEPVEGFRIDLVNDQTLYSLSLRTFTIAEVEAEIERGNRLATLPEYPIT